MSIHSDPRRHSLDEEEYREWQRDLRLEYAKPEYAEYDPYDYEVPESCDYMSEDGSCNCDGHCIYQVGKWKDTCQLWKEESEGEEE